MNFIKIRAFTLLEMMIALIILSSIIVILTLSFNAIQKASSIAKNESEILQNARLALDMISKDIQCIYYTDKASAFYHKGKGQPYSEDEKYYNDLLCFISSTSLPATESNSNVCEVKYQLHYSPDNELTTDNNAGWLMRSVTGDNSTKWNFLDKTSAEYYNATGTDYAFTADTTSSEDYINVIPYVTDLNFICYSKGDGSDTIITGTDEDSKTFPYSIDIELKVLDKNTWDKWTKDPSSMDRLKRQYERTFTKSVVIGNRGQYDSN